MKLQICHSLIWFWCLDRMLLLQNRTSRSYLQNGTSIGFLGITIKGNRRNWKMLWNQTGGKWNCMETFIIVLWTFLISYWNIIKLKGLWMSHCCTNWTPCSLGVSPGKLNTINNILQHGKHEEIWTTIQCFLEWNQMLICSKKLDFLCMCDIFG